MKIYNSIKSGLRFTIRKKGILLLIYAGILVLGIAFSMPIFSSVKSLAGNRLEIQNLLTSFDYTAYQDFMAEYGDNLSPLMSQIKWMVLIYLLMNIFITGGIFHLCRKNEFTSASFGKFMTGGQRHFAKIALTSFIFLLIQVVVGLIVWIPFVISLGGGLEDMSSEIPYVNTIIVAVIIHIILFSYISMISDFVKAGIVRDDNAGYIKIFGRQFGLAIKNTGNTYGLYLIQVFLLVILFEVYFLLAGMIGNSSAVTIFLLFIIQQIFIMKRISLRIFGLSATWFMNQQLLPGKMDSKIDTGSIIGSTDMIKS